MTKNRQRKVIIWHPFPSPLRQDEKEGGGRVIRFESKPALDADEATVQAWIRLADISIGDKPFSVQKKPA